MRLVTTAILLALCFHASGQAACPPDGKSRAALSALKQDKWTVADDKQRQADALALLDCLADPDPFLRDEIAFEALFAWSRNKKLEPATLLSMMETLLARINGPADAHGFGQPFAALALAEVARADYRGQPYLTPAQRVNLVNSAAAYLSGVRDYRGYEAGAGWRHGVAHAADLMLQLSLNPAIERAQHETILKAVAGQIAQSNHAYQFGEPERLMAPVFYLGARSALEAADWDAWFAGVSATPAGPAESMQAKLTRQHNVKAFLYALYASLQESTNPVPKQKMLPAVVRALKKMA
ncbi:MAG: DUF2785 domain-containing protein [Pseudomonadota bacterium]